MNYQGTFDAWIAIQHRSLEEVRSWLPRGISLQEPERIPEVFHQEGHHPVLFLGGRQASVSTEPPVFWAPQHLAYREMAVVVPFLQRDGKDKSVVYPAKLWLDQWVPIFLGWAVGLPKRRESISCSESGMALEGFHDLRMTVSRSLDVEEDPAWMPAVRALFQDPLVGSYGACRTVQMRSSWDLGEHIEAVELELQVGGEDPVLVPSILTQPTGAFRAREIHWRIWPPTL